MRMKIKKGQSTLEYVIILAAVVGAIVLVAGFVKTELAGDSTKGYQQLTDTMRSKINEISIK